MEKLCLSSINAIVISCQWNRFLNISYCFADSSLFSGGSSVRCWLLLYGYICSSIISQYVCPYIFRTIGCIHIMMLPGNYFWQAARHVFPETGFMSDWAKPQVFQHKCNGRLSTHREWETFREGAGRMKRTAFFPRKWVPRKTTSVLSVCWQGCLFSPLQLQAGSAIARLQWNGGVPNRAKLLFGHFSLCCGYKWLQN